MEQIEHDIEQKLGRLVRRHGGECLKLTCPGNAGVPDRLVLMPGGLALFVETKRPKGGRLSPLQKVWRKRLTRLGFGAVVEATDEDLRELDGVLTAHERILRAAGEDEPLEVIK